jgi:pimeloyl-ACP methyl ester carboxylesterase
MSSRRPILISALLLLEIFSSRAAAASVPARSAPPAGIVIPAADRTALEAGVAELGREIAALRNRPSANGDSRQRQLLPDVQLYHKAVQWALSYDEFFRTNEVGLARNLLREGLERARQLRAGAAPWLTATGLVVRGYLSRIDGSVQPYGLVVPASFSSGGARPHRLDVWLHGRDNHLTELKFISERRRSHGEFAPTETFVLHPYGRYCNAFKFAGEVDVFEALEHVRREYPIDERRVSVRGFSMGGAACWHLAAHHAGQWAAAAPGAGFAETAEYTKALLKEPIPTWYEQKLWRLYDATEYAGNLFNCPTIAYSGELDKQKQAADVMARAMRAEGLSLTHLIGPGVQHKYEPNTKQELARRFDELMSRGREPWPKRVRFTTWTLRYNQQHWVTVNGLDRHWERGRVEAELISSGAKVSTTNISELALALDPDGKRISRPIQVIIDEQTLAVDVAQILNGSIHFRKTAGKWSTVDSIGDAGLRKRHGLQGPIDDAFMDRFLMVRPTGRPWHLAVGKWTEAGLAHATNEWRAQFRGDAPVKDDVDVTDADIAASNLVLWGDPRSNRLLARLVDGLPLNWTDTTFVMRRRRFESNQHVPVMVFPNPLNHDRYVVLNSGFTFSEFGNASNARQTPKLPDYAAIDIGTPRAGRGADRVVEAGLFGERWEWREER